MTPTTTAPYRVTWRDRLAWRLANAALRLATPSYRAFVEVSCRIGVEALRPRPGATRTDAE